MTIKRGELGFEFETVHSENEVVDLVLLAEVSSGSWCTSSQRLGFCLVLSVPGMEVSLGI